jgi:hemoglobin
MNLLYERIGGHDGITRLLRHFYADVRQDPLIGPIFNVRIEDWSRHLEVIAGFWEGVIGGPSNYSGPMPKRHAPLQLQEQHFERWLFLWQANCRAQLPSDVAQEMIGLAPAHRRPVANDFGCRSIERLTPKPLFHRRSRRISTEDHKGHKEVDRDGTRNSCSSSLRPSAEFLIYRTGRFDIL